MLESKVEGARQGSDARAFDVATPTPGRTALEHVLRQGGSPDPGAIAKVLATYPADRDDMLRLLHTSLGNAYVQSVLAVAESPATPTAATADPVDAGRERVAGLEQDQTLASGVFHGTSSRMLDGLEASDGRLLSGAQLAREGIGRQTGEGDAYGKRDPGTPQDFVSVGVGPAGMGVAQAYAQATQTFKQFNVELYSDEELGAQTEELRFLVSHYDTLKIDLASFPNGLVEKFQFDQRLQLLEREQVRRQTLPPEHPSRKGAVGDTFPIMFEMDAAKLDAKAFNAMPAGLAFSGDGGVEKQIDLRGTLRRVYCPVEHASAVRARIGKILGDTSFEVIPMESLAGLSTSGVISKTQVNTTTTLEGLESGFQRFVHAYADAARTNTTINGDYIVAKVWTI